MKGFEKARARTYQSVRGYAANLLRVAVWKERIVKLGLSAREEF